MRILHVIECGPKGGAPRVVEQLARAQATSNDVTVVCEADGYLAEKSSLSEHGVRVIPLPMCRAVRPLDDLKSLLMLRRVVRDLRPDLIHAHSSKAGALSRILGFVERYPVVFSPHNFAYRAYEGGRLARLLFYLIELLLAPLSACVHFTCQDEMDNAVRMRTARRHRAIVIENGIELGILAGIPPPDQDTPIIGTYARLCSQKRLDVLIDAIAIVRREHRDVRAKIIGDGELAADLRAQVRELGLDSCVSFETDPGGPERALPRIDIFVLSSASETFPLAVMEALAAGRAVVATSVGGLPEMIDSGRTGLLVPPKDVSALAQALSTLLSDGALRQRLGSAGSAEARRRFSATTMGESMAAAYGSTLARCRPPARATNAAVRSDDGL